MTLMLFKVWSLCDYCLPIETIMQEQTYEMRNSQVDMKKNKNSQLDPKFRCQWDSCN